MIKITKISDVEKIQEKLLKSYLMNHTKMLLSMYGLYDLKDIGAIFVVNNFEEVNSIEYINQPMNKCLFEFVNRIHTKKDRREDIYLLACLVVDNDFAIHIVIKENSLNENQKNFLMQFYCTDEFFECEEV